MGTNWNPPNNGHQGTPGVRTNGHRPGSYSNGGSNMSLPQNPSGSLAPVSGARKLGGRSSVYGGTQRAQAKDCKYLLHFIRPAEAIQHKRHDIRRPHKPVLLALNGIFDTLHFHVKPYIKHKYAHKNIHFRPVVCNVPMY